MSDSENKSKKLKFSNDKNKVDQNNSAAACKEQKLLCGSSGTSEIPAHAVINPDAASISSEEMVFSIPHLLESIFSGCDKPTLLNCRLVSVRWANCGSKALQEIVNIKLVKSYKEKDCERRKLVYKGNNQERPIEDLIELMNNSTEFPCTSFYLDFGILNNCAFLAKPFLMAHGALIKKLRIDGCLFLDELKDILLSQAPNLEQLLLMKWFRIHYLYDDWTSETFKEHARLNAPLFDESLPGPRRPVLKNLKVFQCHNAIPKIFAQQILEVSPNLAEVDCSMKYFERLVNPVNRFHLLKKLELYIGERYMKPLEVAANQDNWAITELVFDFYSHIHDEALHLRAVNAMSKILKGCSATCQKLEWFGDLPHFKILKMPQVKHFHFKCYEDDDGFPVHIFPEGVSLKDIFPNLKSLGIDPTYEMQNLPIQDFFGQDNPVPIFSVLNVSLGFIPEESLLLRFKEMFPNATIRTDANFSRDWA